MKLYFGDPPNPFKPLLSFSETRALHCLAHFEKLYIFLFERPIFKKIQPFIFADSGQS